MTYLYDSSVYGGQPGLQAGNSSLSLPSALASWNTPQVASWNTPSYSFGSPTGGINSEGFGSLRVPANFGLSNFNSPSGGSATPEWLQSMRDWGVLGSTDKNGIYQQGWGGLALGAAQGLGGLYLGMQQYNLAKDSLANAKSQFERNFAAQKATTNANMEDRQRARVASNAGAYQSVGDYMAQNGVK